MSVTATFDISYRLFSGYPDDPGLPLGTWLGQGNVIGDGSGGTSTVLMAASRGTAALTRLFLSIEELMVSSTNNANKDGELRTVNMERIAEGELVRRWAATMVTGPSAAMLHLTARQGILKAFIGAPGAVGAPAGVSSILENASGTTHAIIIGGYFWGPRSINVDGGPSRPQQGLYPA